MPSSPQSPQASNDAPPATSPDAVAARDLLHTCPQRPTQHTLPLTVSDELLQLTKRLRGTGREARPREVIALLIVYFAPDHSGSLVRMLTRPHPALGASVAELPTGRYRGRLKSSNEQLMIWLPSPVTLRLNVLIELIHEEQHFRPSRRQLVSALILHGAPSSDTRLARAYDDYRRARARDAGVRGRPLGSVLTLERPKPGRRPMA